MTEVIANDRIDHYIERDRPHPGLLHQPLYQRGHGLANRHQVALEHVFQPLAASDRLVLQDPPEIGLGNVRLVKGVDQIEPRQIVLARDAQQRAQPCDLGGQRPIDHRAPELALGAVAIVDEVVAHAEPPSELTDRRAVIAKLGEGSQPARQDLRLGWNVGGLGGTTRPAGWGPGLWFVFGRSTVHQLRSRDGGLLDSCQISGYGSSVESDTCQVRRIP